MPLQNIRIFAVLALGATLLASCSGKLEAPDPNPTDMPEGPGLFSGESGNILDAFRPDTAGGAGSTTALGVNTYLWRASLETLAFLPITTADSAGGVIATDWANVPETPDARLRANVLIMGKQLQASGLRVTLFKQEKTQTGWRDLPADEAAARALEDTILTKARALRVRDMAK